jgi:flagellar motor switch protein FliG
MSIHAQIAEPPELKRFSGPQRAAALMLALGQEHGGPIWAHLSNEEVKELSAAIAERLLDGVLPEDRVKEIMEDIRGPSGRTMWDKLSNVSEQVLAGYLRNEYPQTVAVILSKLRPDHAARVIAALPKDMAVDVIIRMLKMDTVQKEVLAEVEQSLKTEFMTNLSRATKRDPHEAMAEVFNALDRQTEEAMLAALDKRAPDSAERIRSLMFTFEDLTHLMPAAISTVVRHADKREMALALKGAEEQLRQLFFSAMTERAAKMLQDDIKGMGPVRAREVEEAQGALVRLAKSLADRGEIVIVDPNSDEAMII